MGADTAADCMKHARPTEQHALLKHFEGTWRAEVKMWMGPGDPHVSTGTMVNERIHNGLFIRHDYKGDPSDGPFPAFEGGGYFGYNTVDGRWEGVWVDNAISLIQSETGHVDDSGKVWTMHSSMTDPGSGTPMTKRSVITIHDDGTHSMEMFFTPQDSKQEVKGMEIHYTRA
ncbi:MAG: DUF1579 domain-containing protein [Phycisphaerales bacterium]